MAKDPAQYRFTALTMAPEAGRNLCPSVLSCFLAAIFIIKLLITPSSTVKDGVKPSGLYSRSPVRSIAQLLFEQCSKQAHAF